MNCRDWKSRTVVSRVPDHPQCPKCGARLIAALKPYEEEQYALMKKPKKTYGREGRSSSASCAMRTLSSPAGRKR